MVCCVRVPGKGRSRLQEVRTFSTMTRSLLVLLGLVVRALGVTRVVMEATSDYWKPPFYLLENTYFQTWLVNAKDVKHLPGRPKTDRLDAVWLCKVAERQMLRPSFVPPAPFRELRAPSCYRVDLIAARTAEKQRVEKLLEDSMIKVSVVVSDVFGVSGRDMMAALVAGERDPKVLAQLARGRCAARIPIVWRRRSPAGSPGIMAFLLRTKLLARVDAINADISTWCRPGSMSRSPLSWKRESRLDEIPGIGLTAAQTIIAEIGLDMKQIPDPVASDVSAGQFAPGIAESAGRKKGHSGTGHGNRYLARRSG